MDRIENNKKAWSLIAEDHYKSFKLKFLENTYRLNPIVEKELGNIKGKTILHLQCNTGADSIALARLGANVTGVDLVPDNIYYARKLAKELGINACFIESNVLELINNHTGKHDIVFTSDGSIGWLPELSTWAKTIRHFLKDDGFFYVHDGHPFYSTIDEEKIEKGIIEIKYPYFSNEPDESYEIGGYASPPQTAKNYFWVHTFSEIINSLSQAGLYVECLREYDRCARGMGGSKEDENGFSYYPEFEGKLPLVFSLKAMPK